MAKGRSLNLEDWWLIYIIGLFYIYSKVFFFYETESEFHNIPEKKEIGLNKILNAIIAIWNVCLSALKDSDKTGFPINIERM